ncbi:MAG TPA: DUF4142 domain-containing protein [Verrucomicrobiae bacterium]|jgi:putative membrane protein|nr:DUF4142 domain-containing protein [Verrucomicrobiae bacterium]
MKRGLWSVFVMVAAVCSTQAQIVEGPALVPFNRSQAYRRNPPLDNVRQAQDSAYFIQQAFSENKFETLMCDMAASRASSDLVKAWARTVARHHKDLNRQIKSLAGKRYTIVSKQLRPDQKAALNDLSALSGPQFDQAFLAAQTDAETRFAGLFESAAASPDDTIKSFAQNSLPILQRELQLAHETASASGLTAVDVTTGPSDR